MNEHETTKKIFTTDWIASSPVFYNKKLSKISHNINEVIDYDNIEIHPEGLNNYLDFGYSVFGQTPVKDVEFLPHSSSAFINSHGKIQIKNNYDPAEKWIGHTSHEDDVLHSIFTSIKKWESIATEEIIIPTSGGYDSRLLNFFITDKSRIRSFSYGISYDQNCSCEVVYAKLLSKKLKTSWKQINIGQYHKYINDWYKIFGISTHAHGMYHIEFYKKILKIMKPNLSLLSGIIGDAWAGLNFNALSCEKEIPSLAYSHGLCADSKMSILKNNGELQKLFWENNKKNLKEPLFCLIWSMRFKLILLSYLLKIPKSIGFNPWSPFLDEKIALGMATIPQHRRKNRIWQCELFKKNKIYFEEFPYKKDITNTLDYQAIHNSPLQPINEEVVKEIIDHHYIRLINAVMKRFVLSNEKPKTLNYKDNDVLKYYSAYLTLKPLELLLKQKSALETGYFQGDLNPR